MALKKKKTDPNPVDKTFDLHRTLPTRPVITNVDKVSKRSVQFKKILKRSLIVLVLLILLVGGYLGFKYYQNSSKIFGGNPFDIFDSSKLKGEDVGRVNILLVGNSADDPGHAGGNLTDSIMVVSFNTITKKAFLLSIPRDLYVNIPNNGYAKINEVYQDGEQQKFSQSGYPTGGMGMLESVVSQKLQIPIDYYALINYTAFRDMVNALGGVTVNIQSSDPRGLYDPNIAIADGGPLKLTNGNQTLNGQQALNLARARGDAYNSYGFPASDFDRTAHQRQLLLSVKDKATSTGVLANPVKLGSLFDALGKNVKTDMTASNAKRLYALGKDTANANIASANINGTKDDVLLKSYRTNSGQSALIPAAGLDDYDAIQAYVKQLISTN